MEAYKKRCEDCASLIMKKGEWCCDECFGQKCADIDDCPEGFTLEEVQQAQELTPEQKKAEKAMKNSDIHVETKKRERKPKENPEKEGIINALESFLADGGEFQNVTITNKTREIIFYKGDQQYKLALSATRKPKV